MGLVQLFPKRFKLVFCFPDDKQLLLDALLKFVCLALELSLSVKLVSKLGKFS